MRRLTLCSCSRYAVAFIRRFGEGMFACMMTIGSAVKLRSLRIHSCSIPSCTGLLRAAVLLPRKASVV